MNISIVGMGYVGKAVQASWLGSQNQIKFYDPNVAGSVSNLSELVAHHPSAIFVCVPTPSLINGECDISIVQKTLDKILPIYSGIVIVKSTVPPEFWKLYTKHGNLFHVPEFLVASNAIADYLNPKFIFIGGHLGQCVNVVDILKFSAMNVKVPIYFTDLVTASLVKYFMNTFLATKVTVLNQFYKLSQTLGADWNDFTHMIQLDARIGNSHNNVPGPDGQYGYGGACFPKDVRAIIRSIESQNISAGIIEAVDSANTQFRGEK